MKSKDMRRLAPVLALLLMACDGGGASVPAREHPPAPPAALETAAQAPDPRDAPVPKVDGRPMWSANSRYTAQENAERAFERNGEAFGATTLEAFVAKAHAFTGHPPKGADTLTRANGDVLIYDASSNTFAVVSKAGAPRTMFKPDDGAAYWAEQKKREAERG